jgi:hypothetical protein
VGHGVVIHHGYLVFIEPGKPVIRKLFRRIDTTDAVTRVANALDRIRSSDPEIYAVRWWREDER